MQKITDMFKNPTTNKISSTNIFVCGVFVAATYKFLTAPAETELMLAYMGASLSYFGGRRYIAAKQQIAEAEIAGYE